VQTFWFDPFFVLINTNWIKKKKINFRISLNQINLYIYKIVTHSLYWIELNFLIPQWYPSSHPKSYTMANKGLKICLAMSLLFLIIVTIATVTLFLTVFKPKDPNIMVQPVGLENFDLSLLTNLTSNVSLPMVITMGNPNYGSFEYPKATGFVNFHDTLVGEVPIEGEFVPARDQITVETSAVFMLQKLVSDDRFLADVLSGSLNFTSAAALSGKVHMLTIFKLKATVYCTCDFSINITSRSVGSKCISKIKLWLVAVKGFSA